MQTNNQPIKFSDVNRDDRQRIEYPDIPELAADLYKNGFIHPLSINQDDVLIAGGRRSEALDYLLKHPDDYPYGDAHLDMRGFLKDTKLHHGIHYTRKHTSSDDNLEELQLIENVQRRAFTWQEETLAVDRIHKLKKYNAAADYEEWGTRETGRLLKISHARVAYCSRIAKLLKDRNHPIWECGSMSEALQWLATKKFDESNRELVKQAQKRASSIPKLSSDTSDSGESFFTNFKPSVDEGDHRNPSSGSETQNPEQPSKECGKTILPDSMDTARSMVFNMSCEEFFEKMDAESVDHVITDPPYGIDMKNLKQTNQGQQNIDRIADTHDVEANTNSFKVWLEGCYKIMRDKGFCVWFCDFSQFSYLKQLGEEVGFKVQSWPLTWVKTTPCMNQRAEYNFTKNTEIAIVFRKGDARLISAQSSCAWTGGLTHEDKALFDKHPFIKPDPLWGWLLEALALPGSTICDPFSGVGSSTLACFKRGYQPINCEIDENHYSQQISNLADMMDQYATQAYNG